MTGAGQVHERQSPWMWCPSPQETRRQNPVKGIEWGRFTFCSWAKCGEMWSCYHRFLRTSQGTVKLASVMVEVARWCKKKKKKGASSTPCTNQENLRKGDRGLTVNAFWMTIVVSGAIFVFSQIIKSETVRGVWPGRPNWLQREDGVWRPPGPLRERRQSTILCAPISGRTRLSEERIT